MQYLYAPWRGTYTRGSSQSKHTYSPFTQIFQSDNDTDNFVVKRLTHHGIILNQYPYNPGHLLIVPYAHVSRLDDLSPAAEYELIRATSESTRILENRIHNPGTNVGLNIGDTSSGGSIVHHLHMHIIPRWHGDTSFLPIMSETKVLSEDLRTVYNTLREPFQNLTIDIPDI